MHLNYSTICGAATCHELVKRKKSGLEVVNPDKFVRISSGKQDLISTVWGRHTPPCPSWKNTLPRLFCRGPASRKPFDFLPSIYPFYMFLAAKTFSVHRRVHNHFTKRILNLILNRKKFFRQENETLDKQKPRQNCRDSVGLNRGQFHENADAPSCINEPHQKAPPPSPTLPLTCSTPEKPHSPPP